MHSNWDTFIENQEILMYLLVHSSIDEAFGFIIRIAVAKSTYLFAHMFSVAYMPLQKEI